MTDDARLLKRIHDLPVPRDFNPMPDWVDRAIFQSLLQKGYLTTFDLIPDEQGVPCIALGVEVTDSGQTFLDSKTKTDWTKASAIATVMAFIVGALALLLKYVGGKP